MIGASCKALSYATLEPCIAYLIESSSASKIRALQASGTRPWNLGDAESRQDKATHTAGRTSGPQDYHRYLLQQRDLYS